MSALIAGVARFALWPVAIVITLWMPAANVFADSPCDQWQSHYPAERGVVYNGPWETDPNAAAADLGEWCAANMATCNGCYVPACSNFQWSAVVNGFPHYVLHVTYTWCATPSNCSTQSLGNTGFIVRSNPGGCQMFVQGSPDAKPQVRSSCVCDPINPANGEVFSTEGDLGKGTSALQFTRYFDSTISGSGDLGPGWRHSYSRSITPRNSSSLFLPYVPGAYTSSLYGTESAACTSGFAQIKGQVSSWTNAAATYAGGVCTLKVGTTVIGTLPIYYESPPTPAPGSTTVVGYDATRDDGQEVSFLVSGSSIVAPPSIAMKLQQVAGGYTLTDENDNVEAYNTGGELLSITTRAGVVETVAYDGAGRLSTVADSFGHQLVVNYDTAGRVSQVVQQ